MPYDSENFINHNSNRGTRVTHSKNENALRVSSLYERDTFTVDELATVEVDIENPDTAQEKDICRG